jgi:hypothetical protein
MDFFFQSSYGKKVHNLCYGKKIQILQFFEEKIVISGFQIFANGKIYYHTKKS